MRYKFFGNKILDEIRLIAAIEEVDEITGMYALPVKQFMISSFPIAVFLIIQLQYFLIIKEVTYLILELVVGHGMVI
ncbi:hypothetical protein BH23BAC1_BH23BAC1_33120 [soil metagenome]